MTNRPNEAELTQRISKLEQLLAEYEEERSQRHLIEEKFKSVFESANVGKSITLPDDIINVNIAFAEMLGYTRDELKSVTWQALTPKDEIERTKKYLEPIASGEVASTRFDKQYLHKDGSLIWADVSITAQRDNKGELIHYITTVVNITERKQVEDALRKSEARFYSLYANASIGIYRTTPQGQILLANPSAVKMLGYESFDEMANRNLEEEGFEPNYNRDDYHQVMQKEGEITGLEST